MLSVGDATARVLAGLEALPADLVPLAQALQRVLASDAIADVALPPWDNSAMDGYAVRSEDVAAASAERPVTLPVVETIAAGERPSRPLAPRTAARIMTGAPVPEGADAVVRVEDTDGGAASVRVVSMGNALRNIRLRGEDVRPGATVLAAGTVLGPAQLGVLASIGMATVPVHRRPRVALLATGNELVDVGEFDAVRRGERIVSSNGYTLRASIALAGAEVVDLGIARDEPEELRERLARAEGCDLLLSTGGISMGAFDYVRPVLERLGGTLDFWRVRMRPGAPVGFGRVLGVPWIGLPGNPVSSLVTFELFARPAIRRLRGERAVLPRPVGVVLDEEVTIAAPLTHFLRARIADAPDGRLHARLTGAQSSGMLTSMAHADALLVVGPEMTPLAAGAEVRAILLGERALVTSESAIL